MKIRLVRPPGFPVDFEGERYFIETTSADKRQMPAGAGSEGRGSYQLVARRDDRVGELFPLSGGFASQATLDNTLKDGWDLPAEPSSLDQTANGIIDALLRIQAALVVWEADESFAICRLEDAVEIIPAGFKGFIVLLRRDDNTPSAPEVVVYVDQCLDVGMAAFSIGRMSPAARPVIANERPTHIAYRFYQPAPQESPQVTTGNLFRMATEFKRRFKPLAS
jgi:hypothetical protein